MSSHKYHKTNNIFWLLPHHILQLVNEKLQKYNTSGGGSNNKSLLRFNGIFDEREIASESAFRANKHPMDAIPASVTQNETG